MTEEELKHFEKLLLEKRAEVCVDPNISKDQLSENHYSTHMADQGTDTYDREMAVSLDARDTRYIHHLNESLRRIKNGTYGICRKCKREIPRARLEAVPHATQCIRCKNEEERQKSLGR